MARHTCNTDWLPLAALLLLGACAQPAAAPAPVEAARVPPAVANNDTNVYQFERQGPDNVGTAAVTARPTAGPGAAPNGTMAGVEGRAKAEAAIGFYAQNALCDGAAFEPVPVTASRYDAAENTWTVYGRCAGA